MGTKVKDENYIVVPGWALTKLELKGNDLLIYSIIYGFSQEDNWFSGSLQYLADWTNSTRQGVLKNLENLLARGLIEKQEAEPTNKYRAVLNSVAKDVNRVEQGVKQSLTNNIDNNLDNKNTYDVQKEFINKVEDIVKCFNDTCGTKFRSNSVATRKLIKRHLREGFSVDDFKKVIALKYLDWGKSPVKFSNGQMSNEFLRPSTLFGDKFEAYVYEALARETSEVSEFTSVSNEVDTDVSDLIF